ncbi:MAG TPA: PaaI family thioesterase [Acidimicrobiales bacterium]|nr:PaaI family thioesterase [Acidimicrobiales bacterium]
MTDIAGAGTPVHGRLGVTAGIEDGELRLGLRPPAETLHHGVVRASVLAYLVDAAAGIPIDDDPDVWTLTTDMTVRMRPAPAPARIGAASRVLRRGRRSVTCAVELTTERGAHLATGAIGFARVARKASDPPKPVLTPDGMVELFGTIDPIDRPVREAAGIEVVDPAAGVVQVELTPELRNPAGTLQGAMVALVAEAAAEDLVSTRFGVAAVVTDLDLRYLAQTRAGPVRTTSRLLGDGPDAPIEVALVDTSTGTLTTLVYARTARADPGGARADPTHGNGIL